jgi:DNA-binding NarL/FixJ family response regulator
MKIPINYPATDSPGGGMEKRLLMAPSPSGMVPMMSPYSVLLADDHEMFRREIRKIVEEMAGVRVVAEVGGGQELFALLKQFTPNLVILDISMPNFRAMEATRRIKMEHPHVKVLILIMHKAEEYLAQAAAAGAEGCLLKEDSGTKLPAAIEAIRRGGTYLAPFS